MYQAPCVSLHDEVFLLIMTWQRMKVDYNDDDCDLIGGGGVCVFVVCMILFFTTG